MLNRRQGLRAAMALAGAGLADLGLAPRRALAAGDSEPAVLPVTEQRNRFLLDVGVNGGGGYRFVLDTGATSHFISTRIVDQLRLPRVDQRMVRGYDGRKRDSVVGIDRLVVGGFDFGRARAIAWAPERLEQHDGLIGYPFLYPQAVLDLAAQRIALGVGPPADAVDVAAQVDRNQALLIGGAAEAPGRFVFDTGSQQCTISAAYHARIAETETYRSAAKLVYRTAGGEARTGAFRPREIAFGDLRIREPVLRIGSPDGREGVFLDVDGLFGVSLIRPYIWSVDQADGGLRAAGAGPGRVGYYGPGLSLSRRGADARVEGVQDGGPAFEAGLRPGMQVASLADQPPERWTRALLRVHAPEDRPATVVMEVLERGLRRRVEFATRELL